VLEGMTKPILNTSTIRMHVDHLEGSSGYIDRVDGLWWKNNKQQGILPISFKSHTRKRPNIQHAGPVLAVAGAGQHLPM